MAEQDPITEHEASGFHDLPPIKEAPSTYDRFTSRKFLITIATAVAAILGASGVIDQAAEVTLVESAVPLLYLIIQGVTDYKGR